MVSFSTYVRLESRLTAHTCRDAFLEEPMDCKFMRNIDSIVISYGTHPATFRCASTPTSVFKSHLASVLSSWPRALAACHAPDARRPTLIYYNAPLMIQTPQQHLECRTGPRMEYWNRLAGKLARDHGWQVVDAFAHTKAFAIDTPLTDGNHREWSLTIGKSALTTLPQTLGSTTWIRWRTR